MSLKNKVKILYIGYGTNLGGIETYLYNLVKQGEKEQFCFYFLVFKGEKVVFYEELKKMGCNFFEITHRRKNYLKFIKDLKAVYKSNTFDYIHFNLMNVSCFERIIFASKYSKAQLIIHSHCGSSYSLKNAYKSRLLHRIGLKLIKNINYYSVACGKQAGDWMFKGDKFDVFRNGVDIEKFIFLDHNRNEIRKKYSIQANVTVIGIVAKLEEQKNLFFLIDLFYSYQMHDRTSKLMIVGEGSLKNQLMLYIKKLDLIEHVILTGKRIDAFKFYSAFDILVMPSLFEGLSITLIEAQANGLKCYTSDSVDNTSNVTKNVVFLTLEDSAKEWADYIINQDHRRDNDVLCKFPAEYISCNAYKEVFKFYKDHLVWREISDYETIY